MKTQQEEKLSANLLALDCIIVSLSNNNNNMYPVIIIIIIVIITIITNNLLQARETYCESTTLEGTAEESNSLVIQI